MGGINPAATSPLDRRMAGDEDAGLEEAHLVSEDMDVEGAAAGGVGDADHALVGDAALEFQHRAVGGEGQRSQGGPLLGEGRVDDAASGGVRPGVGDAIEPGAEMDIEVVEIAEGRPEEEVSPM